MITRVLINGDPSDGRIPVTDSSVLRGDGCFEVVRAYDGNLFALDEHLDRLAMSAGALQLDLPARRVLASWLEKTAADLGDGAVRVIVTRGSSIPGLDDPSLVIVFGHTWEQALGPARLLPVSAPWHAAGAKWELAGAKITSYAPNMAAGRHARDAGYDDALLTTQDGVMLEGPTFSVAWVADGVLETPELDLGILGSITRELVLDGARESGLDVRQGRWRLDRLGVATEVMALSTAREVQPVVAVGGQVWEPGPTTEMLGKVFERLTG